MIHPTAIIDPKATIGTNVKIGPYCVIGPHVVIAEGVELVCHVSLEGHLHIGPYTKIFPFASLGHPPQDLKYHGEISKTFIGSHTTIREYVTIHPGTEAGGLETHVGSHCLLMVGTHVAHDCHVGDHVVMANYATLGGHVHVGDYVVIGGLSAVQQFVHIGAHAMIGGMSGVEKDVIPYGLVMGERAHLKGLNLVGLRRRHFSLESIQKIRKAYECLFEGNESLTFADRLEKVKQTLSEDESLEVLLSFIEKHSKLCLPG